MAASARTSNTRQDDADQSTPVSKTCAIYASSCPSSMMGFLDKILVMKTSRSSMILRGSKLGMALMQFQYHTRHKKGIDGVRANQPVGKRSCFSSKARGGKVETGLSWGNTGQLRIMSDPVIGVLRVSLREINSVSGSVGSTGDWNKLENCWDCWKGRFGGLAAPRVSLSKRS